MHGVREHERTQKRKAQEQREQGKPPASGRRAFGYDQKHTVVIAEEAAVLREAMTRLFAGESLRSICFDLEGRGVRRLPAMGCAPTFSSGPLLLRPSPGCGATRAGSIPGTGLPSSPPMSTSG